MINAYSIGLMIAAIFGWGAWVVVLYQLSPFSAPEWALGFFFGSFFIALMSTFSFLIYLTRHLTMRSKRGASDVNISLRQGATFATTFCILAVLQRLKLLTWWNGILLFSIVVLIEFYLLRRD